MLGAENREAVTCYLDALLFAMFAKLESFECMLRGESLDEAPKRLAALLRLWVNLLRSGKLIETDMVRNIAFCSHFRQDKPIDIRFADSAYSGFFSCLWLDRCTGSRAARHFRSIRLHHRDITAPPSHSESRPVPSRQKGRRRPQGRV